MVECVANGATSCAGGATTKVEYTYDAEHARITQVETAGSAVTTTTYLNDSASGLSSERQVTGSVTTWTDYLFAGGLRVAARSNVVGVGVTTRYYITDHLGSVAVVTDGTTHTRRSYDAWGKARNTNGSDDYAGAIDLGHGLPTRGFTDHEHMPSVGLINMNARVYDPELARFLSADPVVQDIFFSQALNRFAYVFNNPLSLTDPSGFSPVQEIVITAWKDRGFNADFGAFDFLYGGGDLGLGGGGGRGEVGDSGDWSTTPPPPSCIKAGGGSLSVCMAPQPNGTTEVTAKLKVTVTGSRIPITASVSATIPSLTTLTSLFPLAHFFTFTAQLVAGVGVTVQLTLDINGKWYLGIGSALGYTQGFSFSAWRILSDRTLDDEEIRQFITGRSFSGDLEFGIPGVIAVGGGAIVSRSTGQVAVGLVVSRGGTGGDVSTLCTYSIGQVPNIGWRDFLTVVADPRAGCPT